MSPDAGAESADERRGRRRRRRRGRGGRAGEEGASATDAEAAADESFAETDLLIEVPRSVSRSLDFHRAAEVIEAGRSVAEEALDQYEKSGFSPLPAP